MLYEHTVLQQKSPEKAHPSDTEDFAALDISTTENLDVSEDVTCEMESQSYVGLLAPLPSSDSHPVTSQGTQCDRRLPYRSKGTDFMNYIDPY